MVHDDGEGQALAGPRAGVSVEGVDVADGAGLGHHPPLRRGPPHAVLERAVHARDGQAVLESGAVAVAVHGREQADHLVRRDEVGAREPGSVLQGPGLRADADAPQELQDRRMARLHRPRALHPRAQQAEQDLRAQVLAGLVDALQDLGQRRAVVGGQDPRAGRQRLRGGRDPARHVDPLRLQDLGKDGGRVARGVFEGHAQLFGLFAHGERAAQPDDVAPEVALQGEVAAAPGGRGGGGGDDAVVGGLGGALDHHGIARALAGGHGERRGVVVEGQGRDLGAVPPDEVAPGPVGSATVAAE